MLDVFVMVSILIGGIAIGAFTVAMLCNVWRTGEDRLVDVYGVVK